MAKWDFDDDDLNCDDLDKPTMYRHVKTGNYYTVLYEGLEVTSNRAVPSIVYQNADGEVFIRAKSQFEDGRFERL